MWMKKILLVLLLVVYTNAMTRVWHVSSGGSDRNRGTQEAPFKSISKAAYLALACDTILIHEGVDRDWFSPYNGGTSQMCKIVYMSAPGEEVSLKGSELVSGWKKGKKEIWTVKVLNSIFGDFNPFFINLFGDWLHKGDKYHLGEVFLNGGALKEILSQEENTKRPYTWFAEVKDKGTIIYANFGEVNPNKEVVEISVRPTCFFPKTTGINFITVKGLKISQAATQWSAPTSEQVGIIGPNWSKGWLIEDCGISQSKCVGICLGNERASGHNLWSLYKDNYVKHAFNREIEAVLKAFELGWSRENIGSHIIRHNKIGDCGQAGIVGHMGAAFSVIQDNEIYNIGTASEIGGFEMAGIKLHAAIDVILEHNCITNTTMGVWLDWQAQGTHVAGNLIADSKQQDLFIEVSYGPTLVYNNISLSNLGLLIDAQGVAYSNNLIAGKVVVRSSPMRYTPYQEPHSTKIKGVFNNTGGDVRFYNNVFLGNVPPDKQASNGLCVYNDYPSYSEMLSQPLKRVHDYLNFRFLVWASGNVYFNRAKPFHREINAFECPERRIEMVLRKENGAYYLDNLTYIDNLRNIELFAVNTAMLGETFISESAFENTDGSALSLKTDYWGLNMNEFTPMPGSFDKNVKIAIWQY